MKHIVSCVLLSFIISAVCAQGKFKIEPCLSVHFPMLPSSINLGGKVYDDLNASLFSTRSSSDGLGANRSLGFQGEIPFTQRLSFRIGAAYAPKDFIGRRTEPCNCDLQIKEEPIMFKQRYIDVPLSVRYYIYAKRLIVFAEAGAVVNILTRNKTQFQEWGYASKWYVSDIEGVKLSEYMVGLNGGIGLGYAFNNRLDIILTTTYRQVLTEYTPSDNYRPSAIVASLGLAFKFGK
jgi:hypothetical protein